MNNLLHFYWVLCLVTVLFTFGLIARILGAAFTEKSRQLITKHSVRHLIWFFLLILFWWLLVSIPQIERRQWLKSQLVEIRQEVQVKVIQAGKLPSLRAEVKVLSEKTESGNPYNWFWAKIENPELTNSFPLVSKLNPYEIGFSKNSTNEGYVFLQVYFNQWGGGRGCTRYYDLVLTPTNHDELPASFVRDGDRLLKLTNSVYELTWHFY